MNAEDLGIFKMYFGEIALKYIRIKYFRIPDVANKFIEYTLANATMTTTDMETNLRELDMLHEKFRKENGLKSPFNDSFLGTIFMDQQDRKGAGIKRVNRPV